jgi:hypothetical protein
MIENLNDKQLCKLIDNRWIASSDIWEKIDKITKRNLKYYECKIDDDNAPDYIRGIRGKRHKVRANRIFVNVEAVINALIANPPQLNAVQTRETEESARLSKLIEKYFIKKYGDLNVKEIIRKGLRSLYFSRLIVLKPFWNTDRNDIDIKTVNPLKVRFSKTATKEIETEFAIEEIEDTVLNIITRFPEKKQEILDKLSITDENELKIQDKKLTYKECWIDDYLVCKYDDIILHKGRNPYWDWDGIITTKEEYGKLTGIIETEDELKPEIENIKAEQEQRKQLPEEERSAFMFNHFDKPRKPYIFATVLNYEQSVIGNTDFIEQSITLQESVDRRKRQMDDNAEMMNGIIKVDSSVMKKEDAQKLRFETTGIIYGKGVATGVQRETGVSLPGFIYDDMIDSRNEIDNIMAATSAFRGERDGQETKGGRLALVEQSFLRLNELVQTLDFVLQETFNWFYQLSKVYYTDKHYMKVMGEDGLEIMALQQDDMYDGAEIKIIAGKTLPEDTRFKYDRAQTDMAGGVLSPVDYLKDAGYEDPMQKAKNAEMYKLNPLLAVGISPEEAQAVIPQQQPINNIDQGNGMEPQMANQEMSV